MKTYRAITHLSLIIGICISCSLPPDDEEDAGADDYTSELPWSGNTDKFIINSEEGIRLNDSGEAAGSAYLTIPSTNVKNTRWEFGVRLTFNPSANNYARLYLTSSSNVLSESLNGYFIQIGGAKDNIALYRQNGSQPQLLASGRELMKGDNAPKLSIKVECDNNGYWTFWTRLESEDDYVKEKQVKDTSIGSSAYCGIYCVYTKSRCDGFTFHHIQISNDVETNTQPEETPENPDEPEIPDTPELPEDVRGMLLFNEVMYDNASGGAEYVEIYNPTEASITLPALYLYKMYSDGTIYSTTTLQNEDPSLPIRIPSKGYICFTKSTNKVMQKHKVIKDNLVEISNFPSLSNEGGYLALSNTKKTAKGHTFDTCCFREDMHHTDASSTTGISLEKKLPDMPSLNANWRSSNDATGGTPGRKNAE